MVVKNLNFISRALNAPEWRICITHIILVNVYSILVNTFTMVEENFEFQISEMLQDEGFL